MAQVIRAHYGKSSIPVLQVVRDPKTHRLFHGQVHIDTEGVGVVDSYTHGDNHAIVPTDTMKNLVYVLLRRHEAVSAESFAGLVGREMLDRYATMTRVAVTVDEEVWEPIVLADSVKPVSFRRRGAERDWARHEGRRDGSAELRAGFRDLGLLKTTDSGFSGFPRDEFTTLPETDDRILATSLSAEWLLEEGDYDFGALRERLKSIVVELFACFRSNSGQQVAYEAGRAVLEACSQVREISLRLPNLHCNLLDLSRFGLDNPDVVYVPTDSPHGDLNVTVAR